MKKIKFEKRTKVHLMKIITVSSLAFFIVFLSSCNDIFRQKGDWDDNIKLSTKNVDFKSGADSVIIKTQGTWWWVDGISVNDSNYHYYGREDINLESENYKITEDFFIVERQDKNTLFIKMDENNTGEIRLMNISLEAGDYFDQVSIKQAAK
jgi:hypothetical protein